MPLQPLLTVVGRGFLTLLSDLVLLCLAIQLCFAD